MIGSNTEFDYIDLEIDSVCGSVMQRIGQRTTDFIYSGVQINPSRRITNGDISLSPLSNFLLNENNETNDKLYGKVAFLTYTETVHFRPQTYPCGNGHMNH